MSADDIAPTTATSEFAALREQVAWLVERQRKHDELIAELSPLLRVGLAAATEKLDAIEKRGWFATARALGEVAARVLDHYEAGEVQALGDRLIAVLDTLRAVGQPEVLAIVGETAKVVAHTEQAPPIGLLGVVRASRQEDVQKGMAVMMEVVKNIGRVAQAMVDGAAPRDRKAKLAAAIGPRRATGVGRERAPIEKRARTPLAREEPPSPRVVDGVAFGPDGHLVDASAWTRELAEKIAVQADVPLTPARWTLVELARADFEAKQSAPNIRRLTQISGLSTKDIFALFPRAPGRTIARIAGTPKPAGCI